MKTGAEGTAFWYRLVASISVRHHSCVLDIRRQWILNVVLVYEIGEDGKSERTWKSYLAQVQRMYKVHEKGGKPTKYTDPVT
jgi:hypothetical protein